MSEDLKFFVLMGLIFLFSILAIGVPLMVYHVHHDSTIRDSMPYFGEVEKCLIVCRDQVMDQDNCVTLCERGEGE